MMRTMLQAKLHRVRVTEADLRFSTYVIEAPRGSGTISLNGAAARKAMVGDLLIICAYSHYSETEAATHRPVIVLVDENNRPGTSRALHPLR